MAPQVTSKALYIANHAFQSSAGFFLRTVALPTTNASKFQSEASMGIICWSGRSCTSRESPTGERVREAWAWTGTLVITTHQETASQLP